MPDTDENTRGKPIVLVVDDERTVRQLMVRTLAESGCRVLEAADGQQALAILDAVQEPVSLVITDLRMPVMGGRELAARLAGRTPPPPVLFVSGYTDAAHLRELPGPLLVKPFVPDVLAARVAALLHGEIPHGVDDN
ncbi:MAG: response regulator [Gemmatimonadales bacterium]|nr:response regulator [Gemmatimonadales bacterium]